MFTGIIQEIGAVKGLSLSGDTYRLDIGSSQIYKSTAIGDSVAVNGVCLTVAEKKTGILHFDVMAETVRRSNLSELKPGNNVNLEGSLRADGTLGGHFVLGHIDCVGHINHIGKRRGEFIIKIEFDEAFSHLVVEKGSVAIDGVSLTVGAVGRGMLEVYVIPHTLKATTIGKKNNSDGVNLEFDIIGKYASRLKSVGNTSRISEEFLRSRGF